MISREEILAAVQESKQSKRTSLLLRRLSFLSAEHAMTSVFGANYSEKCLQASFALQAVLGAIGIESTLWEGEVCVPNVSRIDGCPTGWHGFWGEDHHIWLVTEFAEFVDLSIQQMHVHRAFGSGSEPMPPLWWRLTDRWPRILAYLPKHPVTPQLTPSDQAQLEECGRIAERHLADLLLNRRAKSIRYPEILDGIETLTRLCDCKNKWAIGSAFMEQMAVPYPEHIERTVRSVQVESRRAS
jgi:hypothetical protein